MPTPLQQRALDAIRAGKATSTEAFAKALKTDNKGISNIIASLRRDGLITFEKIHPRKIDYATMRVVDAEPSTAPTPAPKAIEPTVPQAAPTAAGGPLGKRLVDCDQLFRAMEIVSLGLRDLDQVLKNAVSIPVQFVEGLRALAAAVDGEPVAAAAPTAPKAPKAPKASAQRARRKPKPAPPPVEDDEDLEDDVSEEEDEDASTESTEEPEVTPVFKTVDARCNTLAEFVDPSAARAALNKDVRARKLIVIETGVVLGVKRGPGQRADDDDQEDAAE